jgi:hypothetical protein
MKLQPARILASEKQLSRADGHQEMPFSYRLMSISYHLIHGRGDQADFSSFEGLIDLWLPGGVEEIGSR